MLIPVSVNSQLRENTKKLWLNKIISSFPSKTIQTPQISHPGQAWQFPNHQQPRLFPVVVWLC